MLGVVATTSTPVTFLWQFAIDFKRYRFVLDGWVIPDAFPNYAGLQHYQAIEVNDSSVSKSNKYIFDTEVRSTFPTENV